MVLHTLEELENGTISLMIGGTPKDLTKDCDDCEWHIYIEDKNERRCYWGITMKVLNEPKKFRNCQYYGNPRPKDIKYQLKRLIIEYV
ncbi:MAG: hypothetical protein ACOYT4_00600 [Nanoarchaeota archaeon]